MQGHNIIIIIIIIITFERTGLFWIFYRECTNITIYYSQDYPLTISYRNGLPEGAMFLGFDWYFTFIRMYYFIFFLNN
jgi:hypothetical protein